MVLGVTVRRLLSREAVALHTTREAHTPRVAPDVDVLANLEPVGLQLYAHGQEALAAPDLELMELRLGGDALGLVVTQQRAGDVPRSLGADADLDGVVAVLLVRLVGHNLDLLELQHGAGHAVLADEHARHALLGGEHAGPEGGRPLAALQGSSGARRGFWEARAGLVEALVLVPGGSRRPAVLDAAGGCEGEDEGAGELGAGAGPGEGHPQRQTGWHRGRIDVVVVGWAAFAWDWNRWLLKPWDEILADVGSSQLGSSTAPASYPGPLELVPPVLR